MKAGIILRQWVLVTTLVSIASCHNNENAQAKDALFQLMPSSQTGVNFANHVLATNEFNIFKYRNFYNGGGVAIGDVNNDGKPDIFFTSNQQTNKLYINKGNWNFVDVTDQADLQSKHQWHTGVTMADVNGDGWLDIYVCNSGDLPGDDRSNELYINQKNGSFKEQAHEYGLDDKGLSTQAVFFDFDNDGDLDCFVLNNSYRPSENFGYDRNIRNTRDLKGGHRLYKNDNGHFTDISEKAGIYGSEIGFGQGITVGDVNNDGWEDMYVSNDFFEKDYLYINEQNGTFKEIINDAMGHISQTSMGSDIADINNDGRLDIFTTDMLPETDFRLKTTTKFDDYDVQNAKLKNDFHHQFTGNCLQLNNGDGTFSEIAQLAGISATDWSWGAVCFDFDNDGWKDIFVSSGISKDLTNQDFLEFFASEEVLNQGGYDYTTMLDKMPSTPISDYGFLNQQNLQFNNATFRLGLQRTGFSNGAAYGDLDGDGDLDLVVNNENEEAFVYRNMSTEKSTNHYLKINLQGNTANTFGLGTRVTLYTKEGIQTLEQMPVRGFQSSMEPILNFGTGKTTVIDSLIVRWPGLKEQVLKNIRTDTTLVIKQANANRLFVPILQQNTALYKNSTTSILSGDLLHKENSFSDFDAERLIPKMISTEGPKIATGDINGDGLEDFFIGSASGDTAKLFLQQPNGHFAQKVQSAFIKDKNIENTGAVFFDADKDGDLDLVVAAGGNEPQQSNTNKFTLLYLNDGKGNFSRTNKIWPQISINASCVRVADFDGDGDEDIFIGGRSVPGSYGVIPQSFLLQNDGHGNFVDITTSVAPGLLKVGMVTDAQWADLDGNGIKELVLVGDWMPVTLFAYQNGQLIKKSEIPNSNGWWNCITIADINGDGLADIVAGNNGLNTRIKADKDHPARLYVSDFDKNGQTECIPVYYKTDGKAYPYYLRGDMVEQMPSLKKKLLRFDNYAGKTMEEIFSADELKDAAILKVNQTQSCIFFNQGKGVFTMKPLPLQAQFSPIFGILVTDLNADGYKDIFLGGNFYGLKPETGRFDASYGVSLFGNGQHNFKYSSPAETGLFVRGEVRDIREIKTGKSTVILVARNNETIQIFKK